MITEISPDSTDFIEDIRRQAKNIEAEVSQLDKIGEKRRKLFDDCMQQYKKYIFKEEQLMDRNVKHCEPRNEWYKEQVNKSWGIAVSNRQLILRSVARTNVLKKDVGEWLSKIDQGELPENSAMDMYDRPEEPQSLEGSKLIDKYNQILQEYGHKI